MSKFLRWFSVSVAVVLLSACGGGGSSVSVDHNDTPASTMEEAMKTHRVGTIIPIEKSNPTEDSLKSNRALFREIVGVKGEGDEKMNNIFKKLNTLLEEKKISGYEWDYTYLTVSFPDGTQFTQTYNSFRK